VASVVNVELSARQRGDFQTPEELALQVWTTIDCNAFDLIIEPTFGLGSFLTTMPDCHARVIGWEIDKDYCQSTINKVPGAELYIRDVFTVTASDLPVNGDSSVLVIGNPPWVTNAELSLMGGKNTGAKRNLKSLVGLDALTGKSNFDISEAVILQFVRLLQDCKAVQLALLAKFSVLRNLILYLSDSPTIGGFEFHKIDSAKYFGAAADAGLIKFRIGRDSKSRTCPIYQGINGKKIGEVGLVNKQIIYDLPAYHRTSFMEQKGERTYVWRQGIKHNLKNVLELIESDGKLTNQSGEPADIEPEVLYQFYKSSDIFHGRKSRYVIPVYQRDLKDALEHLPRDYPKLYAYLRKHKEQFSGRKSGIFKNKPVFTVFGIGDYTHLPYKVAIGGLYSEPVFRLYEPSPRPVVVDDTSYMLSTGNYEEAVYLLALLSLSCTREFLLSISHPGDKRRFSKDVLSRVLLPTVAHCPAKIRQALMTSWKTRRSFDDQAQRELLDWIAWL
jgi:hypothetical protein